MSEPDLDIPDDALQEIADVAPDVDLRERMYLYWRSLAVPPSESYRRAGYSGSGWRAIETRPRIRKALADLQEALEPVYKITRERVQAVILEGIEMARRKDQAKVMIEGAVALANIAGVSAPTKMQIQQETHMVQEIRHEQPAQLALSRLPREELERLLQVQRTLPAPSVLEGDFTEVEG